MRSGRKPVGTRLASHPAMGPAGAQSQAHGAGRAVSAEPDCGRLFRDLRRYLNLSVQDLAARMGTTVEVIQALEGCDVSRLPPWPETVRIVSAMTLPMQIDPQPVLQAVGRRWRQHAGSPAPPSRTHASRTVQRANFRTHEQEWRDDEPKDRTLGDVADHMTRRIGAAYVTLSQRARRHWRSLLAVGLPLAVLLAATQTSALEGAARRLPPPFLGMVRSAQEYLLLKMAPRREGMRWIEVDDPRARRTDKLQSASR